MRKTVIKFISLGVLIVALFGVMFRSRDVFSTSVTCTTNSEACIQSAYLGAEVRSACTIGRESGSGTYTSSLSNGSSATLEGTIIAVQCNDVGGYGLYAIGYSNDTNGNTDLIYNNTVSSSNNIKTDGTSSNWKMGLFTVPAGTNATIISTYRNTYGNIPSSYTKVATLTSSAAASYTWAKYQATASATQAAGSYTGKVKYTMVHPSTSTTPLIDDLVYLQDFYDLTSANKTNVINSMADGQNYTLKDKRDNQDYTIARLADDEIWMTEDLNLAGGTTLSYTTSDFDSSYTIPTTQGWQSGGKLPASSTTGFTTANYAYVYNSGNKNCSGSNQCYSYYSWDAATLGSGRSMSSTNDNTTYSICPKGWRLPSTSNVGTNEGTTFRALGIAYGGSKSLKLYDTSTIPTGATLGTALKNSPTPHFSPSGYYVDSTFSSGGSYYWSSTVYQSTGAQYLRILARSVELARSSTRKYGFPVRCVLR